MKNKKRFLMTFLIVILCMTLLISAFACDNGDEGKEGEDPKPETELLNNGSFASVTGDTYPKTPTGWSAAPGSSSSSSNVATPSGSDNLISGVISVDAKQYNSDKKQYGKVSNPYKPEGADEKNNNVLMIYNKKPTSYKYTSSSIDVEKDKYYKLTFNVKTVGLSGTSGDDKYGAYIYVNGDAYSKFEAIDTEGKWSTYEMYVEGSLIKSGSLNIVLSLGIGDLSTGHMTKGHAYFANLTMTDLTDVKEGETAFNATDFDKVATSATVAKYSMQTPDADFDYASSTTSTPYTPAKWNGVAGYGSGHDAVAGSSYVEKGIIDSKYNLTDSNNDSVTFISAQDGASDTMLLIKNKQLTAYGYRATVAMRFGNAENYKVSVRIRTGLDKGTVHLKLTDGTNTDTRQIEIANIDTKGQWETYSFIIQGNDLRANDMFLELWLGQGGKTEVDTHAKGYVLMDCISLEKYEGEFDINKENNFSLKSKNAPQPIGLDTLMKANYEETIPADQRTASSIVENVDNWASSGYTCENPKSISETDKKILVINNKVPSAFTLSSVAKGTSDENILSKTTVFNPNTYYLVSLWVKTLGIPKGKGLTVDLISYDDEKTSNTDYDKSISVIKSASNLNSEDSIKDSVSKNNNGYVEIKFFVQSNQLKNKNIGFKLTLGTGTRTASENHIMGYAFIAHPTYEEVAYSEYSNASTGTTTQTASLVDTADSSEVSSNGKFNFIDIATTNNLYEKKAEKENKTLWNKGMLVDYLGAPTGWTISNKSLLTEEYETANKSRNIAGIFNHNQNYTNVGFYTDPTFDNTNLTTKLYPNVLALKNKSINRYLGYTSNATSLTANSYYVISVWAKADVGNYYSINLTNGNNLEQTNLNEFKQIQGTGKWEQHFVYVQTGMTSASVKLGLYAGSISSDMSAQDNEVFFTNATYTVLTQKAYEKYVDNKDSDENKNISADIISWFVDTFDAYTTAENSLAKPSNWSAQSLDSDVTVDNDTIISGVFDKTYGDWSLLNIDPDKQNVLADKMFGTANGDTIFALYNKIPAAYQYNSSSASLTADTYYKISIAVLTYGLNKGETASITLKINNKTYKFGKYKAETDNEKARLINTSTYENDTETIGNWTTYSFYVKTDEKVTASAVLSVGLGFKGKDNRIAGYVFADNFSVEKIDKEKFIEGTDKGENPDNSLIDPTLVPNNFRIVFTSDDAKAPEEELPPEDSGDKKEKNELLWLWITSGIVGGVMVVAVVVVLIKKFAPKKKKSTSLTKGKKRNNNNNKRDQFDK